MRTVYFSAKYATLEKMFPQYVVVTLGKNDWKEEIKLTLFKREKILKKKHKMDKNVHIACTMLENIKKNYQR